MYLDGCLLDAARWGIPTNVDESVGIYLAEFWGRYREWARTRTRDSSDCGLVYMKGQLLMDVGRNFTNIERRVLGPGHDGQRLQHFMSESPWNAHGIFHRMQQEVGAHPDLQGGVLCLDDSGDKRSGKRSAGAARQYLGRLGKVDLGQVMVGLSYSKGPHWLMVDAEPYIPEVWFDEEHRTQWPSLKIPPDAEFRTKTELGYKMITLARQSLSFEVLACDSAYGRDGRFRQALDSDGVIYMADVPGTTRVWLDEHTCGQRGQGVNVRDVPKRLGLLLTNVQIRPCERGMLDYDCAARLVWTAAADGSRRQEWFFVRRETSGKLTFSLSNAPPESELATLARWRCERYFVERTFQDCKSELGWDELQARKYPAWMHHTALTALTLWFIVGLKLKWAREYPQDPKLGEEFGVPALPTLSVSNVRVLLQAVMPLPELSRADAVQLVTQHLRGRTRSTRSRSKRKSRKQRFTI